jgi:hypothetical protein
MASSAAMVSSSKPPGWRVAQDTKLIWPFENASPSTADSA